MMIPRPLPPIQPLKPPAFVAADYEYVITQITDDGEINLYFNKVSKPLTDEQIHKIDLTMTGKELTTDQWINKFARAIERAHGIGENDD